MFQVDRNKHSHKGNNGKVLIVGGSEVYAGAPSLVGLAALRTGADLAYILAPRRAADTAKQFIDLITEPLSGDHITKDNYPEIKRWLTKADVLVIGSGLGQNPATKEAVLKIVDKCEIPMVIDADALKALEGHMDLVQGKQAILTPHINEFKLLSGLKTVTPKDVKQFAIQHKVITVVTGQTDIISNGKVTKLSRTGNPGMSHGGTGDVLTGIIGGLIGQNIELFKAAEMGTFISGKAGDMCSRDQGYGFLASDVITKIPEIMRWRPT